MRIGQAGRFREGLKAMGQAAFALTGGGAVAPFPCDPYNPVSREFTRAPAASGDRRVQRARKSIILATIRRLLTEHGADKVTVRRVAEASGYSVQTIYNLAGRRDEAITEAISEYSLFVGRTAMPDPADPEALFAIIDRWCASIERRPEFGRQANLIFFTQSRSIYYEFRKRQFDGLRNLLMRQRSAGLLRAEVDTHDLAEQLTRLGCDLWLEWADRPFPLDTLHRKLQAAFASMMSDKFVPEHQYRLEARISQAARSRADA